VCSWAGLGIVGDIPHRFGRGVEQYCVDLTLVLERDPRCRRQQGEDNMGIRYRQQLGLTRFEQRASPQE
jgi:hypothetical protein